MILNTIENIEKAQKKVEKLNGKFIKDSIKKTQQRHVKEENEPLLDMFIEDFRNSYAKNVVGNSMVEIVKIIKDV